MSIIILKFFQSSSILLGTVFLDIPYIMRVAIYLYTSYCYWGIRSLCLAKIVPFSAGFRWFTTNDRCIVYLCNPFGIPHPTPSLCSVIAAIIYFHRPILLTIPGTKLLLFGHSDLIPKFYFSIRSIIVFKPDDNSDVFPLLLHFIDDSIVYSVALNFFILFHSHISVPIFGSAERHRL